jgi:hypothetical protein
LSHLSDSSRCPCEDDVEDNFQYFYVCPLFTCQIILLFTQLRDIADFLNIDVLLKGSADFLLVIIYLLWTLLTPLCVEPLHFSIWFCIICFESFLFIYSLRWLNKYISIVMCMCMHMYEYAFYVLRYTCTYVTLIYKRIY